MSPNEKIITRETPTYEGWNDLLVEHFFNSGKKHKPVRLAIEDQTLDRIGGGLAALARACVHEAKQRGLDTVQDLALALERLWRELLVAAGERAAPRPPFLAVLVLFVKAVDYGTDLPAHAYYDRLHELLGHPDSRIDSIQSSLALWNGLAEWSSRLLAGRLGYFEASMRGKQRYVGIPRRQVLLAAREEQALAMAFAEEGLRPGSDPSDRSLHDAARKAEGLLARTRELLAKWPQNNVADELLDEIRSRFEAWDRGPMQEGASTRTMSVPLRLVLRYAGRALTGGHFETESIQGSTERDAWRLVRDDGGTADVPTELWVQAGDDSGRPILVDDEGNPEWARPESWFARFQLRVDGTNVVLTRSTKKRLVFARRCEGVLEETDEADLRLGHGYVLVVPSGVERAQPSFADFRNDRDWHESPEMTGVVHRAFSAIGPTDSPESDRQPRIRLVGGIPSSRGSSGYVSFALPDVEVELPVGASRSVFTVCYFDGNGRILGGPKTPTSRQVFRNGEWPVIDAPAGVIEISLPDAPTQCQTCEIGLTVDGVLVDSKRIFVDFSPVVEEVIEPRGRNAVGELQPEGTSAAIRGLSVTGSEAAAHDLRSRERRPARNEEVSLDPDIAGRRLMQLLRTRRQISWTQAKLWLPGCLPRNRTANSDSVYLLDQVMALHALGILELEENVDGGLDRIAALPPGLALLPRLANLGMSSKGGGLDTAPEALLVGCWLDDELKRLEREARREGMRYSVVARNEGVALAPHRRSLIVHGDMVVERLQRLARQVRVAFHGRTPLACRLASVLSPIESLAERSEWRPGRPSSVYQRRFFDPRRLCVAKQQPSDGDRYQLWECRERSLWHHFVVDTEGDRYLEVHDRQLGRWFVRRFSMPRTPVPVSDGTLFVPSELRLPRVLERAFVLGSGHAPRLQRFMRLRSPFVDRSCSERFGIPAPPERQVDWLASRPFCTGNYCCYEGAYDTAAWTHGSRMPMLGVHAEAVTGLGLGS